MKRNLLPLKTKGLSLLSLAAVMAFSSCTPDEPAVVIPETPTTYSFENVDYSGQTARIQMLSMLESKAKSANEGTTKVTAEELNAIFTNASGDLAGSSKDIASKTESSAVAEIQGYFADIETYSGDPRNVTGGYLVTEEGLEPAQMIAKGLMGALLYYQATSVYLGDDKMNVDNTEVTEGKGTAMQHHWDEAFGYFGAPTDYLTADEPESSDVPTEKSWYWAKYANSRATVVDVREAIFTAFIEGRAAIDANDMEARDQAIATIRKNWELLIAANVVHYNNAAIENLENNDVAKFYHHASEGKAFLGAFKYNLDKSIKKADLDLLETLLTDNPKAAYADKEATITALEDANVKLQDIFGFSNAQMLAL